MQTIVYHFKAIVTTFEQFAKGRFFAFLIPGTILTLLLFWTQYEMDEAQSAYHWTTGISWFDSFTESVISKPADQIFSVLNMLVEQFYIFAVITLMAPFNTLLSEKLDTQLTGQEFKSSIIRFLNDFFRMIFVVIIMIIMEYTFMLTFYVLTWIVPGLDYLSVIMYPMIAAFFFGFGLYDFTMERYRYNLLYTLGYAFTRPLTMIISGGIFLLIYKIPIVGVPLAPVLGVMITTIVFLYQTQRLPRNNELQNKENDQLF